MTINYTLGVPNPNNSPSVDQPVMTDNSTSLFQIWDIDHYGFNDASNTPAGQHQYVTFPVIPPGPPTPTGNQSVLTTYAGSASSLPQLGFTNAAGGVFCSSVRAFGYFKVSGSTVTLANGNQLTMVRNSTGQYTGTIVGGVTATANFSVLVSCNTASSTYLLVNAAPTGITTFGIAFVVPATQAFQDPLSFSVAILQL